MFEENRKECLSLLQVDEHGQPQKRLKRRKRMSTGRAVDGEGPGASAAAGNRT